MTEHAHAPAKSVGLTDPDQRIYVCACGHMAVSTRNPPFRLLTRWVTKNLILDALEPMERAHVEKVLPGLAIGEDAPGPQPEPMREPPTSTVDAAIE
jgi:hypothetical protein